MTDGKPKIAIIDPNTLAVLGLKCILQDVMPFAEVDTFGSFAELDANTPESYFHYFVSVDILLNNRIFFAERRQKTIVLTLSLDSSTLSGFHNLCINVPERQLVKALLALEQSAHAHGRNLPPIPKTMQQKVLSERETEVMALIVQGLINKEIADRLNISLATVVTHRKNIMDKLHIKSVSALTIYAVMNGFVDINKI
ncbi:MAG: response regulator transcription factor [Prevotella sp.]